jgi:hypothetical protein
VFIFEEPVVVPPRKVRGTQSGARKGKGSKRGTGRT